MFPDPTSIWLPVRTIIDGIASPPFVFDQGLWNGVLSLIVVAGGPEPSSAFGLQFQCLAYFGMDELIYDLAGHGDQGLAYDGVVYLKEAQRSRFKDFQESVDPLKRIIRHYALIGRDFCFEVLAFEAPKIFAFASAEDAYGWSPQGDTASEEN